MQSLVGKVALVTGASSGIGEATAIELAKHGADIILAARRSDRINTLADKLSKEYGIRTLTVVLDVCNQQQVIDSIHNLPAEFAKIDILINNAGLALGSDSMQNSNTHNWNTMIDTNIKGLLYVTHAVLPIMIKHNNGHIVNISSIAGIEHYSGGNVYSATKHAVRAISKSLRLDLNGYQIRVSDIAPGATNTEFSTVRWKDKQRADEFYSKFNPLVAEDIADTILFCVTRKPHVNVESLVVYPTDQACATMLHYHKE